MAVETIRVEYVADVSKINLAANKIDEATVKSSRLIANLNRVGAAVAASFAVSAIAGFTKEIIEITAEFQKFEAVLTNTLGSRSVAVANLKEIQKFAAVTPFSVQQLTNSFVKLANQGFVPTVNELRKMGDLAASTGKPFDQLIEAVLDAQTGQFTRLKEFGIKAQKEGDNIRFSFKGVETQVKFNSEAIREYMLSLGDLSGVSGSMAAISQTLEGQLSNLGDNFDSLKVKIGNELAPIFTQFIGYLNNTIDVAKNVVDSLGGIGAAIKNNRAAFAATLIILTPLVALLNIFAINTGIATVRLIANAIATRAAGAANLFLRNELVRLIAQYTIYNLRLLATRAATLAYSAATIAANVATRLFNGTMALLNIRMGLTLVTWNTFLARMLAYPAIANAVSAANARVGVSMKLLSGGIVAIVATLGAAALAAKAYADSLDQVTDSAQNIKDATAAAESSIETGKFQALIDRLNDTKADSNRADIIARINKLIEEQIEDVNLQQRLFLKSTATLSDIKSFQEDIGNAIRKQKAERDEAARSEANAVKRLEMVKQLTENLGDSAPKVLADLKEMGKLKFEIDKPQNLEKQINTATKTIEDAQKQIDRKRPGVGMADTIKGLEQIKKEQNERLQALLKEQQFYKDNPQLIEAARKKLQQLTGVTAEAGVSVSDMFRLWAGAIGITNEASLSLMKQLLETNEIIAENGIVTDATIEDVLRYDATLEGVATGSGKDFKIKIDEISTSLENNIQPIIDNIDALKRMVVELERAEALRAIDLEVNIMRTERRANGTQEFTDAEMERAALDAQHRQAELQLKAELEDQNKAAAALTKAAIEDIENQSIAERAKLNEHREMLIEKNLEVQNDEKKSAAEKQAFAAATQAEILRSEKRFQELSIDAGNDFEAEKREILTAAHLQELELAKTFNIKLEQLEKQRAEERELLQREQTNRQIDNLIRLQREAENRLNAVIIEGMAAPENTLPRRTLAEDSQFIENERLIRQELERSLEEHRQLFIEEEKLAAGNAQKMAEIAERKAKGIKAIERQAFISQLENMRTNSENLRKLQEEQDAIDLAAFVKKREDLLSFIQNAQNEVANITNNLLSNVINNQNLDPMAKQAGAAATIAINGLKAIQDATVAHSQYMFAFENTEAGKRLAAQKANDEKQLAEKRAFLQKMRETYGEGSTEVIAAENEVINAQTRAGETEKQLNEKRAEYKKEQVAAMLDLGQQTVNIVGGVINDVYQNQINLLDQSIAAQQQRIDFIQNALDQGGENAKKYSGEQVQVEKERLEKLQEIRRADIQKQQAFALIQMILNTGIAITQAAAQGGVAAPITIAITLASLVAGLIAARAAANGAAQALPQAAEGGVVGAGKLVNVAKGGVLSGARHSNGGIIIEAEDGERIFDRQTSAKYKPFFDAIAAKQPFAAPIQYALTPEFSGKFAPSTTVLKVEKLEKEAAQTNRQLQGLRSDMQKQSGESGFDRVMNRRRRN